MEVGREKYERTQNHNERKHADLKEEPGKHVKSNDGHVCQDSGSFPEQEKGNGEIVKGTCPTENVGACCVFKQGANDWEVSVSG